MKRVVAWVACAWMCGGCTPSLSKDLIRSHPRIKVGALEPQLVAKSEPMTPLWIRRGDKGAADWVSFVGQAVADTEPQAKDAALRDLLSAVSNFVAVEVETEFESKESEQSTNGQVTSESEAREVVKTKSASRVEGVRSDQLYWEKWAASPLSPESVSYRYYLHARVAKAEIARARVAKQLAREKASGKRSLVLLPFRPALVAPGVDAGPIAAAFAEELSTKLASLPNLHVADPGLVRGLAADRSEAEAIEAVRDALLPDVVVSGTFQLHADRLRVSWTVRGAALGASVKTGTVERPYAELFQLEDALAEALRAAIGGATAEVLPSPKKSEAPRVPALEERYHRAYELYHAGKNREAVALLSELLREAPSHARAQLRLGHVLERLGRYGRLAPHTDQARTWTPGPGFCIDTVRAGIAGMEVGPSTEVGEPCAGDAEACTPPGLDEDVDTLLSAAAFALTGPLPSPGAPEVPRSAVAAYWNALRHARVAGDVALERQAALALADLAVRTDRLSMAEQLYGALDVAATRAQDLHLRSLVRLGIGRVHRGRGDYGSAERWLEESLQDRVVLGEKPYLLEIMNELGGVAVDMSDFAKAERWFGRAWRIADDLDDDYFRAILSNNLGVLEYSTGRAREARDHFARAFDHLRDLEEAEGQISSALNLSLAAAIGGQPERGRAYLVEAERIIGATSQEGRRAAADEARGLAALASGRGLEAVRSLYRAWAAWQRLGRSPDALRAHNAVVVAQLEAYRAEPALGGAARSTDVYRCLAEQLRTLLLQGYGDESVAPWYRGRRYYGDAYPVEPWPVRGSSGQREGASNLVARMNAEVLGRLEP